MPNPPRQLILLRHAKSDWHAGVGDFDRPLNDRGRRDAPRMGKWLADNGYAPARVVASAAARAKETAVLVCAELNFDAADIVFERALYGAPARTIGDIAARHFNDCRRVLLVAHNPGLEYALHDFCPDAPAFADGKLMPTCAAAVIEFGGDGDGDNPRLLAHMRPAQL